MNRLKIAALLLLSLGTIKTINASKSKAGASCNYGLIMAQVEQNMYGNNYLPSASDIAAATTCIGQCLSSTNFLDQSNAALGRNTMGYYDDGYVYDGSIGNCLINSNCLGRTYQTVSHGIGMSPFELDKFLTLLLNDRAGANVFGCSNIFTQP